MPSPWWPVLVIVAVGPAFALQSRSVARAIGHSPNRFASADTAHDFVGRICRIGGAVTFAFLVLRSLWPDADIAAGRIPWLARPLFNGLGLAAIAAGGVVIVAAERQMGASWRIGIDPERTELVTTGLFGWSRNPTFLGMLILLAGVFLATPTAVTAAVLAAAWVAFSVQVRMEEQHLQAMHGEAYTHYRSLTARWIGREGNRGALR